jgi:2,3-bisphosphoglycerate-independent phosphoglycerate mutase
MVGHTGVFEAAVKAVETVDECVGKVVDAMLAAGGIVCVTADHGNADQMIDAVTGEPFTAHTTNQVPFIVCGAGEGTLSEGKLADIAPTMLGLVGMTAPDEMTGINLFQQK